MKIVETHNIGEFLHFVAREKRRFSDWQFLHVSILNSEQKLQLDEVIQFLEFQLQSDKGLLLLMRKTNELLFFTHKDDSLILSKFEKSVYENFSSDTLRCLLKGFENDGLEHFSKIVKPYIFDNKIEDVIAFRRMSRQSNCLLVLDDDPMVLKQLEKALSSFGNVIAIQDADEFEENYTKYAPNVLFLDIHLRTAKGNEILKSLKSNLDPKAHVVMISSDTHKEMILDIKHGGANGFVVKPFDRNKLYKEVMKTPTIVTRAS